MWKPETEDQIKIAIDDGNIYESSSLDVKADVGDTPSSRKETAKDLSSFAIDGGALLIGVGEVSHMTIRMRASARLGRACDSGLFSFPLIGDSHPG